MIHGFEGFRFEDEDVTLWESLLWNEYTNKLEKVWIKWLSYQNFTDPGFFNNNSNISVRMKINQRYNRNGVHIYEWAKRFPSR